MFYVYICGLFEGDQCVFLVSVHDQIMKIIQHEVSLCIISLKGFKMYTAFFFLRLYFKNYFPSVPFIRKTSALVCTADRSIDKEDTNVLSFFAGTAWWT